LVFVQRLDHYDGNFLDWGRIVLIEGQEWHIQIYWVRRDPLMRQAGERIGGVVRCAWMVFYFEVEFWKTQHPTLKTTLSVREVHDPTKGMLVRSHGVGSSPQVGP
jgi:hypothetical protein